MTVFELWRVARSRLRALVHRTGVVDEIDEEIRFHLDERAADLARQGLSDVEARRAARAAFGHPGVVRDRGYDVRGGGVVESVLRDLRYGVRLLLQQKDFSLVALVTLALGIGATSALFCIVDAVVIHPLPYPHPEQLVQVYLTFADRPGALVAPSIDDMDVWRSVPETFTALGTWRPDTVVIVDGQAEQVHAVLAEAGYLTVLGVQPVLGRSLMAMDAAPGADPVVMLGYRYWQSRYGGRPDVLGRLIHFSTGAATIVGVLPSWLPDESPVWRPLSFTTEARQARGNSVVGRLVASETMAQARDRLAPVSGRLRETGARGHAAPSVSLRSMAEVETMSSRTTVDVLALAVGFVLLIACVNVASLQLARGATRQTELAVRAALGAGRARLIRQLLIENVVLSVAGAALGTLLSWLLLDSLMANSPISWPGKIPAGLNLDVLLATIAVATGTGLAFGLAPALTLARVLPGAALSHATRGIRAALSRRASRWLIATEIAAAVILLACAALMMRSFARLGSIDLGFRLEQFVTLEVAPIERDAEVYDAYYPALLHRIREMPNVVSAGATNQLPLGGSYGLGLVTTDADGGHAQRPSEPRTVLPGYFEAIGVPLLAGRLPTEQDRLAGAAIAVLSERAAREFFPGMSAVGHRVYTGSLAYAVIGVVGDITSRGPSPGPPEWAAYYVLPLHPAAQTADARAAPESMIVVVKPRTDAAALLPRLREAAQSVGPPVLVRRVRRGEDWWDANVTTPRQRTVLLGLLGGLGVLLALVGVFGVTAFAVARRTQEIGVRLALGARPVDVIRTMLADAAWPIAVGTAVGLVGAAFATKAISSFLFQTTPRDPATFGVVAAVLLVTGGFAAWLPARRAAGVDPSEALRLE